MNGAVNILVAKILILSLFAIAFFPILITLRKYLIIKEKIREIRGSVQIMTSGTATSLNEEAIRQICKYVREGAPYKNSFLLSGFGEKIGEYWRSEGKKDDEKDVDTIYASLYRQMNQARAEFLHAQVRNVVKAGEDPAHWTASIRILESADPDNFSRNAKPREIEGYNGKKSAKELIEIIIDKIGEGGLSPDDGAKHVGMLSQMVKIEENYELKHVIESLENKLGQYQQRVKELQLQRRD